jgi:hypothetical protein
MDERLEKLWDGYSGKLFVVIEASVLVVSKAVTEGGPTFWTFAAMRG